MRATVDLGLTLQERWSRIRGSNLAAAISMRAFLALFPIALLAIAAIGVAGGDPSRFGKDLAEALGLGSDVGHTLATSVQSAESQQVTSSLIGIVGLIWTGAGLGAAMSAAWDTAWSIDGGALRSRALGTVWLVGGLAFLAATVGLSVLLHRADVLVELGMVGGVLASSLFLFWTALLLPRRHLPWRAMVRPAVYGGVALEILRSVGATVVPALVRRSSSIYGAIGATFALLIWLLVMGEVIVMVAVYERHRWEHRSIDEPLVTG